MDGKPDQALSSEKYENHEENVHDETYYFLMCFGRK